MQSIVAIIAGQNPLRSPLDGCTWNQPNLFARWYNLVGRSIREEITPIGSFKVVKTISMAALALSLLLVLGCSEISDVIGTSSPEGPDIVRQEIIGEKWQMNQMRVHVDAGDESTVLLKLSAGDSVDGYFYLEKGLDIVFQLVGNSLLYELKGTDMGESSSMTSNRFSFVATQQQGTTYSLTFRNPTDVNEVVFLEVIYPIEGTLFFPIGAN